jgi:hypothetical protein
MTTNVQIVVIIIQSAQLFLLQEPGMHVLQVSAYDITHNTLTIFRIEKLGFSLGTKYEQSPTI